MNDLPESLTDVWTEARNLEEHPFEDVRLLIVILGPHFVFWIIMFDEIKEDCARFPNDKVVAFVVYQGRNTSVGVEFEKF
jgi:hypothetical protein